MKLRGKNICVLILFGIVILIAFTYVIYPNISLGCEGDARLYHNHVLSQKTGIDHQTVFDNFVYITVNGKEYTNLSIADRMSYGLMPVNEDEQKIQQSFLASQPYEYEFFRRDIGKKMGIVEQSNYPLLKDLQVFYYAEYPKDDNICILKLEDGYGYQFFIAKDIKIWAE